MDVVNELVRLQPLLGQSEEAWVAFDKLLHSLREKLNEMKIEQLVTEYLHTGIPLYRTEIKEAIQRRPIEAGNLLEYYEENIRKFPKQFDALDEIVNS